MLLGALCWCPGCKAPECVVHGPLCVMHVTVLGLTHMPNKQWLTTTSLRKKAFMFVIELQHNTFGKGMQRIEYISLFYSCIMDAEPTNISATKVYLNAFQLILRLLLLMRIRHNSRGVQASF